VNAREFIDRLVGSCPSQLKPSDEAVEDLMKCIKGLRYNGKQLGEVYDEVLKVTEYFPKPYHIIEASSRLEFSITGQKPKYEASWELFEHRGRRYAKKRGVIQPESVEDYYRRIEGEACDISEGLAIFEREYRDVGGLCSKVEGTGRSWEVDYREAMGGEAGVKRNGAVSDEGAGDAHEVEVEYIEVDDSMYANPEAAEGDWDEL